MGLDGLEVQGREPLAGELCQLHNRATRYVETLWHGGITVHVLRITLSDMVLFTVSLLLAAGVVQVG